MLEDGPGCSFSMGRRISAPAEAVWKVLSCPGHLEACHPFCEKNPVVKWPGVGSRDTVCFYNGRVLHREFSRWEDGSGYTVDIVDSGGEVKSEVSFRVREHAPGSASELSVVVTMRGFDEWPAIVRRLIWELKVKPSLRRYFSCVLKGFEHHLVTGEPVAKNQFGIHRDFSDS